MNEDEFPEYMFKMNFKKFDQRRKIEKLLIAFTTISSIITLLITIADIIIIKNM